MADRQRLVITNYSRIIAPYISIVKEETAASSPMTGKVLFSKWLISTVRPQKVSLMFPLPCQYHAGRRGINREIKFRKTDFNRPFQFAATDMSLAASFLFRDKTRRARILPLLASDCDPECRPRGPCRLAAAACPLRGPRLGAAAQSLQKDRPLKTDLCFAAHRQIPSGRGEGRGAAGIVCFIKKDEEKS